jgi:hypothetical protein
VEVTVLVGRLQSDYGISRSTRVPVDTRCDRFASGHEIEGAPYHIVTLSAKCDWYRIFALATRRAGILTPF